MQGERALQVESESTIFQRTLWRVALTPISVQIDAANGLNPFEPSDTRTKSERRALAMVPVEAFVPDGEITFCDCFIE